METGIPIPHHLRKFDGEPFELRNVVERARELLKTKPSQPTSTFAVSDEGLPPDFSPIQHGAGTGGAEVARQH